MKKFLDLISEEMQSAFGAAGYDETLGKVTLSNRPDLCEYQCNGAMSGAKIYKKAPVMIANDVAEKCKDSEIFSSVEAVAPGFLNLKVRESFVKDYLAGMRREEKFGLEMPENPARIIVDYGLMWPSLSMWDICVRPLSARASRGLPGMRGMM